MKLDTLLTGQGIPATGQYAQASPERFGQVGGAIAQAGQNLEAGGVVGLDIARRQQQQMDRLNAVVKKIEEENAAEKMLSAAEIATADRINALKANPDPLAHQAKVEAVLNEVRDQTLETEKRPGVIQGFTKAWEKFSRTQTIHAGADEGVMKVGAAQADTLKIVRDLENAAGGTIDPAAFKILQDGIEARFTRDAARGIWSPKEAFTLATKSVDQAYINRAMGDARRNPAGYLMRELTGTNPYADKIHAEQREKISDFAQKRLDAQATKVDAAFKLASGETLKTLTIASRAGDVEQQIVDQAGALTVEHFERALSINDAQKKARNVGVTDERVLTTVRELVDTRQIRTPDALRQYAGSLSQPDYQLQLDKVTALAGVNPDHAVLSFFR